MIFHPSLKKISSYLDNRLTFIQQESVRKHLDGCEKCKKKVSILDVTAGLLRIPASIYVPPLQEVGISAPVDRWDSEKEIIGEIQSLVGKVNIHSGSTGEEFEAFPGCALRKGDTIRTVGDSKALVEWNDGNCIYINKDSEVDFRTSQYPVSLRTGEIFSMMKPQRETFEIWTPAAVLSVVGTDFDTEVNKKKETILRVLKGKVGFKNKMGEVVVNKNKQVEGDELSTLKVTPIHEKEKIKNWVSPIAPIQNQEGVVMKKAIIGVLVIVIVIAGYFGYQYFMEGGSSIPVPKVQAPDLPTTTESSSKEPLNFKAKWNVGEKQTMRMEIVSDTQTKSSNAQVPAMTIKQNITEDISLTTLTTRSEGGYVIAFQIEQFKMDMDMNTVKMVYDSNSEGTTMIDKAIGGIMHGMIGKPITMVVNGDGKVESVSGMSDMLDEMKKNSDNPMSKVLETTFSDEYFKNLLDGFNPGKIIPQHPIQVGETWTYNKDVGIPSMGKMAITLNYTFTGWKEYDGVTCALLNYTGVMKTSPNATTSFMNIPGMQMNMKDAQFAGYTFADPVKGVAFESSANQNMPMEMKMTVPSKKGPQEQTMSFLVKQQVKTKLLKVEKVASEAVVPVTADTTVLSQVTTH